MCMKNMHAQLKNPNGMVGWSRRLKEPYLTELTLELQAMLLFFLPLLLELFTFCLEMLVLCLYFGQLFFKFLACLPLLT